MSGTLAPYVTRETDGGRVAGYYCFSAFSLVRSTAAGALSRNAPDPIPAVLLGTLAVDRRFQGAHLGTSLLRDAVLNATTAAERIGMRALIVDALDDTLLCSRATRIQAVLRPAVAPVPPTVGSKYPGPRG